MDSGQSRKGKVLKGLVVSDRMDKSIVVEIKYQKQDRRFKKTLKGHKKIMVHDEDNKAKAGDQVRIQEGRPVSKRKVFYFMEILSPTLELKAKAAEAVY